MAFMQIPFINPLQYGDAGTMDTAFGQLATGVGYFTSHIFAPGLVRPGAVSFGVTGLSLGYSAPDPFGVFFTSGQFAGCHGVQTNVDSNSGSVSFAAFVPTGAGIVTGYLAVAYSGVFQNPISIPGPPAGNPGYNPNYVGVVGYTTLLETLSISATSAVPDNLSTFELARVYLTSATVTLSPLLDFQVLASVNKCNAVLPAVTGAVTLNGNLAKYLVVLSGTTATLPSITISNGLVYHIVNIGGPAVVQTTGELILGAYKYPAGSTFISLPQYGEVYLEGINVAQGPSASYWQVGGGNLGGQTFTDYQVSNLVILSSPTGNFTVPTVIPGQNTVLQITCIGGGGGGGGGPNGGGGGGAAAFWGYVAYAPGTVLGYSIGSGGVGGGSGNAGANGTNGGQTSFASGTAAGGQGGESGSGSINPAGSGGIASFASGYASPGQPGSIGWPGFNESNGNGFGGANGLGQIGGKGSSLAGSLFGPGIISNFFNGGGGAGAGNTLYYGENGVSGIIIIQY